jgi:hypothetical protein
VGLEAADGEDSPLQFGRDAWGEMVVSAGAVVESFGASVSELRSRETFVTAARERFLSGRHRRDVGRRERHFDEDAVFRPRANCLHRPSTPTSPRRSVEQMSSRELTFSTEHALALG